ncbi:cytochrome P450 [Thamnocephalis sphaerospora]|uniref:Cytochrome P450 n=1 Tax=Thamnocephalis sphaerospora TaxID=78915 RepID=A0A4P9XMI9_9FUNG|nr:cytochrome P450 [Thamnocephalis sphaerospora]|eukprot:RKP07147.1 cytochrome P450 [Thamnocephalis sphaerospora]
MLLPEIARRFAAAADDPKFVAPVDLLQFICDSCSRSSGTNAPKDVINLVMFTIFISLSDITFHGTHFLYDIAGRPEMRAKLYEEQQQIVAKHGTAFTKEALQDMTYMDACLRETLRLHTGATNAARMSLREVTFANGMSIPAGRLCLVHTWAANRRSDYHGAADDYMPERTAGQPGVCASTTGPSYTTFGMGRTPCPGRFFAISEIKSLAAWLLRRYEFATESGRRPGNKTQKFGEYLPVPEPVVFAPRNL